ncbi:MAG: hypothetical protein AVDCRST_MAG69-2404 [uncultured Solirubrobacteraceae bacterium]|uniref:L,D-TPase catalytic domain-containing protein n=1 Tax=uncultured Solirubrobacteraceae bacterium TaxID=1162706 RepID=A0A6J4T015_9ACTN|nr:MAG: hypothetical protein AVDCRST_MAG69-2404 [uncultured Solirubrobacteraceae bacterium]
MLGAGCGRSEDGPARPGTAEASEPAFVPVPTPAAPRAPSRSTAAARSPARWMTARLTRGVTLRSRPGGRVLARLSRRTEFGSPRVLGVVSRRGGWLRVVSSELDNDSRGWMRAAHADLGATAWSVHIDRSARRLVLRRAGRRVKALPVAVGRPGTPTPLGRYATTDELLTRRPGSPYGCCIIALSGHQTKLVEGWPGGDRLAIHATPQTDSIGRAASLGCLRAHAADVRRLMRRLPLGAPVFVTA